MPLPARIIDKLPKRVRICADGREGKVDLVYYDRLHTGDSYDELQVSLDNGKCVRGPANLFEAIDAAEEFAEAGAGICALD
jgi:hypothetical protein